MGYDWDRKLLLAILIIKWTQWMLQHKWSCIQENHMLTGAHPVQLFANEQVVNGACERCSSTVTKKDLEQWFFKITKYAQRLLDDIEKLKGWPEKVKTMQQNWIGRSEGVEVDFKVDGFDESVRIFTTIPDTIFGVTYMVMALEHSLVKKR